jgi:hypothetical protein
MILHQARSPCVSDHACNNYFTQHCVFRHLPPQRERNRRRSPEPRPLQIHPRNVHSDVIRSYNNQQRPSRTSLRPDFPGQEGERGGGLTEGPEYRHDRAAADVI